MGDQAFYSSRLVIRNLLFLYVGVTILLGNEAQTLSVFGLRLSQLFLFFVAPWLLLFFISRHAVYDRVVVFAFLFIGLGFLQVLRSLLTFDDWSFVLANSGLFFYSLFFFTGLAVFDAADYKYLFCMMVLSCFLGIIFFVVPYYIENGSMPFLIRRSSDVLPMVAAGMVVPLCINWRIFGFSSFLLAAVFLFFSLLTFVKGVVLAVLVVIGFLVFKRWMIRYLLFCFAMYVFSLLMLCYMYDYMVAASDNGDIFWFNIVSRYVVVIDYVSYVFSDIWRFFIGSGFVPFISDGLLNELGFVFDDDYLSVHHHNPHNSYLLLLFNSGFLGLILFYCLVVFSISNAVLRFQHQPGVLVFFVLFLLAVAITTPVFELHYIAPLFWVSLAAVYKYTFSNR